jgi:hypothetical protein
MSEPDETGRICELFERLVGDAAFRSAFRRDPAMVCRTLDLDRVARAFADDAPGVQALDSRHAPSSLAGVLMAAAMESVDLVRLLRHAEDAMPGTDGAIARRALSHTRASRTLEPTRGESPVSAGDQHRRAQPAMLPDLDSGGRGPGIPSARPGHAGRHTGPVPTLTSHDLRTGAVPAAAPAGIADHSSAGADYPGDHASAQRIAAWMAHHAERRGLPGELPVMAALVESNLRNLPDGDATSVGYFQMQTSVWLKRYPGYPDDPQLQLKWFIDEALRVRAGNPELARDPSRWGEWVASVEKPLEINRWKYAARLTDARALLHREHAHHVPDVGSAASKQPADAARTGAAAVVVKSADGDRADGAAATAPTPGARTGAVSALDSSARAQSSLDKLVHLAASANLPGKPLQPETLGFLRRVAEQVGHAITIGTGTNHSKLTVNGSISDHYTGHAADIPVPVDSPQGDRIAASALIAAGYTPEEAWQRAHEGGLWTIPNSHGLRIQVIWKTYEGGNHHNHVHIGARPA